MLDWGVRSIGEEVWGCPESSLSGFSAQMGTLSLHPPLLQMSEPTPGRASQRHDELPEVLAAATTAAGPPARRPSAASGARIPRCGAAWSVPAAAATAIRLAPPDPPAEPGGAHA